MTNVVSPVVSYQYYDSFASEANSAVTSPVVSYQYFDALDASEAPFLNSADISYFYNIAPTTGNVSLHGRVLDGAGFPVAGAIVTASIQEMAQTSTKSAADGSYALQPLATGVYCFSATHSGYVADQWVVSLGPSTSDHGFRLDLTSAPLQMAVANSTPAFTPPSPTAGKLMVFDGTGSAFSDDFALIDPTKMTIVLTHGWIPSWVSSDQFPDWPTNTARALALQGVLGRANILAWDWHDAAFRVAPPETSTLQQGSALGTSLYFHLGQSYSQPLHFIGHSLGTLVNAAAANYLMGESPGPSVGRPWSPDLMHLTLLDEAAVSVLVDSGTGAITLFSDVFYNGTVPVDTSLENVGSYASPIPVRSGESPWLDNYISAFGYRHAEAVNVRLQKAEVYFSLLNPMASAFPMHNYAIEWYTNTILEGGESLMGFTNSFERTLISPSAVSFPPSDPPYAAGGGFQQNLASGDWLKVSSGLPDSSWDAPWGQLAEPEFHFLGLGYTTSLLLADYLAGQAQKLGSVTATVTSETKIGLGDAFNYLISQAVEPATAGVDLIGIADLGFSLATELAPQHQIAPGPRPMGGPTSSNTPACIWLPVMIPTNVSDLVFNFTVSGSVSDDAVVCGIDDTNLFSLPLMFLAANQVFTSSLIDVSPWVGSSNLVYFGILGGTSTNATIVINNIQFISFAPPGLSITQTNGAYVLSWPSSANGFALESATDLTAANWAAVTNVPSLFGHMFSVTASWSDQTRFFRLKGE